MKKSVWAILAIVLVTVIVLFTVYSLQNRNTVAQTGTVLVFSDGKELIPYESWNHSDKDGVAADAIQIMARNIEDELETIKYSEDFKISISGNPLGISYVVYTENFGIYNDSTSLKSELNIPSEPGDYIIRVQVTWGKQDNSTAYDYVFKLKIN